MNNSTGDQAREVEGRVGPTAEQALLLRLASAVESLVVYTVLTRVLPRSLRDRLYHQIVSPISICTSLRLRGLRCGWYLRLGLTFILSLLIITVRFYDFLETNILR